MKNSYLRPTLIYSRIFGKDFLNIRNTYGLQ